MIGTSLAAIFTPDMSWFLIEYWGILVFIALVLIGFGFCMGVYYQNTRAFAKVDKVRRECSQQISRAFSEGREQGIRESKPKHGANGRFIA